MESSGEKQRRKLIKNQKERMPFGYEANFCAYEDEENAASRSSVAPVLTPRQQTRSQKGTRPRKDPFRATAQPGS